MEIEDLIEFRAAEIPASHIPSAPVETGGNKGQTLLNPEGDGP